MQSLRAWFAKVAPALREKDGHAVVCCDCKHMFDAGLGEFCGAWSDKQPWRASAIDRHVRIKRSRLCRLINTRGRCRDFEEGAPFIWRDGIGVISPEEG